jgi:hypothetical protein
VVKAIRAAADKILVLIETDPSYRPQVEGLTKESLRVALRYLEKFKGQGKSAEVWSEISDIETDNEPEAEEAAGTVHGHMHEAALDESGSSGRGLEEKNEVSLRRPHASIRALTAPFATDNDSLCRTRRSSQRPPSRWTP